MDFYQTPQFASNFLGRLLIEFRSSNIISNIYNLGGNFLFMGKTDSKNELAPPCSFWLTIDDNEGQWSTGERQGPFGNLVLGFSTKRKLPRGSKQFQEFTKQLWSNRLGLAKIDPGCIDYAIVL